MRDLIAAARLAAIAWAMSAAGCLAQDARPATAVRALPAAARPCPAGLDAHANCYTGRDGNGAWVLIAMPRSWNRMLVVHAHGGPRLGTPEASDPDEDLDRFAVMVRSGFAWVGSSYRRGGFGVRMAGEDVDNSRQMFWDRFGRPDRTILHGQSYGGNVAAKLAEMAAPGNGGPPVYDGVLLTNAILWGGTRAYGFRAELRAVYQYYCRNHPAPDEPQYPVWQGLPLDSRMTAEQLETRVNACLGLDRPAGRRSADQQRRVEAISRVTRIDEGELLRHLNWATFSLRDLVQRRLGGRSVFDNRETRYAGSPDDDALNAGIARFAADPDAVAELAHDSDLSGRIAVPTIALHWLHDPIVSANADLFYEGLVAAQGNAGLFLRLTTAEGTHSRLSDAEYQAVLTQLVHWIATGQRPEPGDIMRACRDAPVTARRSGCSFL